MNEKNFFERAHALDYESHDLLSPIILTFVSSNENDASEKQREKREREREREREKKLLSNKQIKTKTTT